jgi:hypothetical protein
LSVKTFNRADITNWDRLRETGSVDDRGNTVVWNSLNETTPWTTALQAKLENDTSRIQSAQVIAQALNKTMSITGASHASVSLKQMLSERKAKIAAAKDKLDANMGKLDQATAALESLGTDVGTEADDLLASIGQFKNNLG